LINGLISNNNIVSLDLSSNQILEKGSNDLFDSLTNHPSLTAIDLSNSVPNSKNIIGNRGCYKLRNFLQQNKIFTILNIAENEIGKEGLDLIVEGLQCNTSLISLDISKNNLPTNTIFCLSKIKIETAVINCSQLNELILKSNNLVDKSIFDLYELIINKECKLERINLSCNKISSVGANKLFYGLIKNAEIKNVDISENYIEGAFDSQFEEFCKTNKTLSSLNLSKCGLSSESIQVIANSISLNCSIISLNLSFNYIDVK